MITGNNFSQILCSSPLCRLFQWRHSGKLVAFHSIWTSTCQYQEYHQVSNYTPFIIVSLHTSVQGLWVSFRFQSLIFNTQFKQANQEHTTCIISIDFCCDSKVHQEHYEHGFWRLKSLRQKMIYMYNPSRQLPQTLQQQLQYSWSEICEHTHTHKWKICVFV